MKKILVLLLVVLLLGMALADGSNVDEGCPGGNAVTVPIQLAPGG